MVEPINIEGVPAWLEIPSSSRVAPPVQTRLQELPLEQIRWEDFERLCVRLVRCESDIEHCQLYGERGQKQSGIDIFGRLRGASGYAVYQCRQVDAFGPAAIRAAVDDFLRGKWSERTSRFVLCTTNSGIRTQHADVIEEQAAALAKRQINFEPWDHSRISELLKGHPELVDDFFGREWVKAFCGLEAAHSLVGRLDVQRVQEFRAELGRFYRYLFDVQDPGIPIPRKIGSPAFALSDRYVLPDVDVESDLPNSRENPEEARPPDTLNGGAEEAEARDPREWSSDRTRSSPRSISPQSYASRPGVEECLERSRRSIVIGVAGSGKSSLLRYLINDLYSDSPTLARLASNFGTLLPVWLPFAFWTQLISRDKNSSLGQCLKQWLDQWDQAKLWPLVEDAIGDRRLLLLVDGLDEWTDQAAGRLACQRLHVFVEERDLSAIVVTRPYGYARMPLFGSGWQAGHLASLSDGQRGELCAKWFRLKHLRGEGDRDADEGELVRHGVDQFLSELSRSSDLLELSRVPFLLLLLLYLRLERGVLPTSRFKAFELILEHLIDEHPASRRTAASLGTSPEGLRAEELERVLAHVAFEVQETRADGLISDEDLREMVREFLMDETLGLGLESSEARSLVGQFTEVAEGTLGILVRNAPKHLGFFHRSLQEYLAGSHVSRLELSAQKTFVQRHFDDARWRDVLLALFCMTRRPGDLRSLVDVMNPTSLPQRLSAAGLRAQAAFGDFNCPADLAKRIAEETFSAIEREPWMAQRELLLEAALQGMHTAKTGEVVRGRVRRWAYARNGWRPGWFEAIGKWPQDSITRDVLMSGLHDEDPGVQRAAARALAAIFRGDGTVGDDLADIALRSPLSMMRAASIEGLGLGWPDYRLIERVLRYSEKSPSVEVRLAGLALRLSRGEHRESDLDFLLELSRRRREPRVSYHWSAEVPNALVKGWSGSEVVKKACLDAWRNSFDLRGETLSESIAISVLLRGFPRDSDVARCCAEEISGTRRPDRNYPFIGLHDRGDAWNLLRENFSDDPAIGDAIDSWAEKNKVDTMKLALAALVCRTPKTKQILIETLSGASFPHWSAWGLLEGWGITDPDVSRVLLPMVNADARVASQIAHLILRILRDESRARARLLEILRDPVCIRHDLVVVALGVLSDRGDEDEIVSACFDVLTRSEGIHREAVAHDLVGYFPKARGIRDLARRLLGSRNPPISAAAVAFADDAEIRSEIAGLVPRLPVVLRGRILAKLASEPAGDSFAESILKDYDVEGDDELKTVASVSYHRALRRSVGAQRAKDQLLEGVSCYGPDHDERRRAAFAGLLVLERLDAICDLQELTERREPVSIDLGEWNEPNIALVRLIAEKWDYLKSVFGDSLPHRISRWHHDCWSPLCLVASEFRGLQEELLSILDTNTKLATGPAALRFAAAVKPGSQLLLDRCFAALTTQNGDFRRGPFVAAEILAEHFRGDSDVHSRLLKELPVVRNAPLLFVPAQLAVALCLGWPDSEVIDELYRQELERYGATGDHQAFFEVRLSRYPTSELSGRLKEHLVASGVQTNPYISRSLARAAIRRIARDENAAGALMSALAEKVDETAKASIPRLLAAAKGLSPDLTAYCVREIEEQLKFESPQLGFDVISADIRGVHVSLLDALNAPARAVALPSEVY